MHACHTHVDTHTHMYMYIHIIYIYIHIHTYIYIDIHTHMHHTYLHTYMHTYIHTYAHAYILTHIYVMRLLHMHTSIPGRTPQEQNGITLTLKPGLFKSSFLGVLGLRAVGACTVDETSVRRSLFRVGRSVPAEVPQVGLPCSGLKPGHWVELDLIEALTV